MPTELGGFALFDVGRVFLEGESSDRWHHAEGGGLWLAFAGGQHTVSCAIAHAEGSTSVYLRGGLLF
jgi:hypothetical protein